MSTPPPVKPATRNAEASARRTCPEADPGRLPAPSIPADPVAASTPPAGAHCASARSRPRLRAASAASAVPPPWTPRCGATAGCGHPCRRRRPSTAHWPAPLRPAPPDSRRGTAPERRRASEEHAPPRSARPGAGSAHGYRCSRCPRSWDRPNSSTPECRRARRARTHECPSRGSSARHSRPTASAGCWSAAPGFAAPHARRWADGAADHSG